MGYDVSMTSKTCPKCNGSGYLSVFAHVVEGRCFKCDGTGDLAIVKEREAERAAEEAAYRESAEWKLRSWVIATKILQAHRYLDEPAGPVAEAFLARVLDGTATADEFEAEVSALRIERKAARA